MKAAVMRAQNAPLSLEEVNIESDAELLRKYKYDIPVITIDGEEAFRHRVDPGEFKIRVIRVQK